MSLSSFGRSFAAASLLAGASAAALPATTVDAEARGRGIGGAIAGGAAGFALGLMMGQAAQGRGGYYGPQQPYGAYGGGYPPAYGGGYARPGGRGLGCHNVPVVDWQGHRRTINTCDQRGGAGLVPQQRPLQMCAQGYYAQYCR